MHAYISMVLVGLGILLILIGLWAVRQLWKTNSALDELNFKSPFGELSGVRETLLESPVEIARAQTEVFPEPVPFRPKPLLSDPAKDRERMVCILARHDKLIQGEDTGIYISLAKYFEEMGFLPRRATGLEELIPLLKNAVPGVLCVDCRLNPHILRDIARLAHPYPELRRSVFLFYNIERTEVLTPPSILPHAHFLGMTLAGHQITELLSAEFKFEAETHEPAFKPISKQDTGATFEGLVSENALTEILQFLEIGRRTGLLSLETDQPAGAINFEEGEITFAQTHFHEGVEAIFEILSLTQGKFRFFPGQPTGANQPRLSATQVLMQWVQHLDETGEMVARGESDEFPLPF